MKQLTRIITCATLLLFVTGICQAKNLTQSGALLEINGSVTGQCGDGDCTHLTQPVDHLRVNDGIIHSGVFRSPAKLPGLCGASDNVITDAYVLQGGSATGCDPQDPFETSQGTGAYTFKAAPVPEIQPGYQFDVSTIYCTTTGTAGELPCPQTDTETGKACNTTRRICTGGSTGVPDTGFIMIKNNGHSTFTGTMSLSGTPATFGLPSCPSSPPEGPLDSISFGPYGDKLELVPGESVTLALSQDSSNCGGFTSDTMVGEIRPVSPGTTTVLLPFPQFALGQKVTLFNGTIMNGVAAMRDVLKLVDGPSCDNLIAPGGLDGEGSPGDPFFNGSPIAGTAKCARVSGTKAGTILNECFDAQGNQFADCSGIDPTGAVHPWIGFRSKYSSSVDPDLKNPIYVYMHDNGTGATNVTIAFRNGCTTPPCVPNGGPGHPNGLATVGDQNLTCQVFPMFSIPSTARPGQLITVTGTINPNGPCFEVAAAFASQGLLTFTFEGRLSTGDDEEDGGDDGVCRQRTISIPHLPKAGLPQGGSPIDLSSTHDFSVRVRVPDQACPGGTFKLWATIIAVAHDSSQNNNLFYNSSATFTVQNGH